LTKPVAVNTGLALPRSLWSKTLSFKSVTDKQTNKQID